MFYTTECLNPNQQKGARVVGCPNDKNYPTAITGEIGFSLLYSYKERSAIDHKFSALSVVLCGELNYKKIRCNPEGL